MRKCGMQNYTESGSIMWSALQLYAKVRDADEDFIKFKKDITPVHGTVEACRDYRLRWIVQLIVRYYLHMESDGMSEKKAVLPD